MCDRCNYRELLEEADLEATAHRVRVLATIGGHGHPVSAQQVYETVRTSRPINRVTVYRILETLVQHGLVERLSGGARAFFYGLAPNAHHAPHPHFFCRQCGRMDCLQPGSVELNVNRLEHLFPGQIENVAVRVDGVCKHCLTEGALPGR
jgi:Fur family transcriptional regulator, ferric uptake regulator